MRTCICVEENFMQSLSAFFLFFVFLFLFLFCFVFCEENILNLRITFKTLTCTFIPSLLKACDFSKSNTPPWVFFTFLKLYKCYQIAQRITIFVRFAKLRFRIDENVQVKCAVVSGGGGRTFLSCSAWGNDLPGRRVYLGALGVGRNQGFISVRTTTSN